MLKVRAGIRTLERVGAATAVACSLLTTASRRSVTQCVEGPLWIVWIDVEEKRLRKRLRNRNGHWYSAGTFENQLRTAQRPVPGFEENVVLIDGNGDDVEEKVDAILSAIPDLEQGVELLPQFSSVA